MWRGDQCGACCETAATVARTAAASSPEGRQREKDVWRGDTCGACCETAATVARTAAASSPEGPAEGTRCVWGRYVWEERGDNRADRRRGDRAEEGGEITGRTGGGATGRRREGR